ncbi:MAG TPA: glycoside hydrolase family 57 protein [Nitrospiraceae bacterium]|nr:glycoside hydrolase family 57 protein [Nitrospiraceae bacterium]
MKTVHICFLWHMHQPYYTDPVAGSASMPWVRLHATKAYYDMAYGLEKFPAMKATFNFTPSLLRQLQEVGSGKVRDLFLEHAQRPAADLRPEEKAFLVRHFFSANWATMVRPYPRYHELLVKRGADVYGRDLERVAQQFSTQDLLDLQTWHNLAWFGYGTVNRYPHLAALRAKNRGFTEEEKQEVLAFQLATVQDIIPLYRRLMEREQIELTTTPFFHPILPLLIDTDFTRRARPDLPLPSRFHAPKDAEAQLQRAVECHTATFGRAPVGLWPSEGSVCPELIPMLPKVGLRWLATDEGILARSLDAARQPWQRNRDLYQPYLVGSEGQDVTILFRDREISDAFGFVYHKTTPETAAEDVLRRLRQIIHEAPQDQVTIAIVLDGENPWEHYHEGGEQFLSLLYKACSTGALDHDAIRTTTATISNALEAAPATRRISHLHSGSWINQDYKIWIGHQEDNRGWDLVSHTRSRLAEIAATLPSDRAQAAWDELYAAEGSDWFWWYGDDFDTDYKEEFDRLFRTHLRNVWTIAGLTPPDLLNEPICSPRGMPEADLVTAPLALLNPSIDGLVTDFFEWRGAGRIKTQPPLGAMWKAEGVLADIQFGWSLDQLYLRLDLDEHSQTRQEGLTVELQLQTPEQLYHLSFLLAPAGPDQFLLSQKLANGSWQEIGPYQSICHGNILELAVPFKDLQLTAGQEFRMTVLVLEHRLEIARYPYHKHATFLVPGPEFDANQWRV